MTTHRDLFAALAAPFARDEVKTRPQGGRQLSYVTARTVMNRLDEVLGPENWWDDYAQTEHGALCRLTIRLPDGQLVTKCDAGGCAGMADAGDDDKSGISDAFKRAAVKFGVGRYLYRDGVPHFDGQAQAPQPPPEPEHRPEPARNGHGGGGQQYGDPRTGKALFAWIKKQDDERNYGLLKHINKWSKLKEFGYRMVDWTPDQVAEAWAEATRRVQKLEADRARTVDATDPRRPVFTQAEADMPDDQWEDDRE